VQVQVQVQAQVQVQVPQQAQPPALPHQSCKPVPLQMSAQ
jgi:hypothetical protein